MSVPFAVTHPAQKKPAPVVAQILSEIDARKEGYDFTAAADLCKAARVAPSSWHSWRKGTTSPKLEDVQALAEQVGANVGLIPEDVAQRAVRSVQDSTGIRGGDHTMREFDAILELVQLMHPEAKHELLRTMKAKIAEMASTPTRAGEASGRATSAKNS